MSDKELSGMHRVPTYFTPGYHKGGIRLCDAEAFNDVSVWGDNDNASAVTPPSSGLQIPHRIQLHGHRHDCLRGHLRVCGLQP